MDWLLVLLVLTVIIRGMGAGIIYDVALVSLPVRRQIGLIPYARYARAIFAGNGVKTYATVSIVGLLLTITVTAGAFIWTIPALAIWSIIAAFLATILAFIGTFRALPAVLSLRKTPDDESTLKPILDRFAFWHTFSTVWQVVSFIALVVALAGLV